MYVTIAGVIPLPSPRTSSSSSSSAAAAAAAASCSLCCCSSLWKRHRADVGPHEHGCARVMQRIRVIMCMVVLMPCSPYVPCCCPCMTGLMKDSTISGRLSGLTFL